MVDRVPVVGGLSYFRHLFGDDASDIWCRPMEPSPDGRLGLGYHQLRLVGRYRSRRNADLRDPLAVPSGLAYRGQPGCGSHDHICGDVCGSIPDLAYGPGVAVLLYHALPQYAGAALAELQLATALGRICHLDILHRFPFVLVHGSFARSGDGPRPGQIKVAEVHVWDAVFRLVGLRQTLAAA